MSTVTISLPDSLKRFVEQEVSTHGFGNVSEYFRSLLREAQAREAQVRLDARLMAGLDGGPASADARFWNQLRTEAQRLLASHERSASNPWPLVIIHHREALERLCRQQGVRELSLVGASARTDAVPATGELEFAVHLGELADDARATAYAQFSQALAALLECPIDMIEIGSMGPTRLRRLLEQTRRVLYPLTQVR